MNIYVVSVLCLVLVTVYPATPAAVFSEDGKHAEEEIVDKPLANNVQGGDIEAESPNIPTEEPLDSSSSDENESHKKINYSTVKPLKGSSSESSSSESSSSESSSSEEVSLKKSKIQKRSLDSKQESVNSIGKSSNQTIIKLNNNLDKNSTSVLEFPTSTVIIEYSSDESPAESSTPDTDSSTSVVAETTTQSGTEGTTETELETTTEAEQGKPIDAESETTTENEETTAENESVTASESEPSTPPDTKTETTPQEGSEISEEESQTTIESVTTSTTADSSEKAQPSSEDDEDTVSSNVSSTPSTDTEPSKPENNQEKTLKDIAMDKVNKLSDQIRQVLFYYRKAGVVVVPGQNFFPDPMPMQDFRQSFSIGTMDLKNMRLSGLSNFTVEHINTDVDRMQVYILLHMKRLVILGNYTLRTFFSRAAGPFNVTLLEVDSEGVAEIQTAAEGHLEAADSVMDMFTQDMKIDFKNLGYMGSMVGAVGEALFNSIKPQILERVNVVIRTDVNKKLKEFSTKFINKVNPVDLAFSEGRRYCRTQGYDPYNIRDHTFLLGGLVYVNITDFWVEGLSRFYRVGNLTLSMDSGVIEIGIHVITGKLTGHCHWSGQTFGIAKYGKTNFTIDHLQVRAIVNQSLDIRQKPQLEDLDLELGWVKVKMDSPMTLNLMIEGIINAFPRLIRHMIVDTLELPLKEKIQEILNKINVETIVDENLPRLDSFGL